LKIKIVGNEKPLNDNSENNNSEVIGCISILILFIFYYLFFGFIIYPIFDNEPREGYGLLFFLFTNPILSIITSITTMLLIFLRKRSKQKKLSIRDKVLLCAYLLVIITLVVYILW